MSKKVIMTRDMAKQWLASKIHPEYRMRILYGSTDVPNLLNMLKSFRDRRLAMSGIPYMPDLGIRGHFDSLEVWSTNKEAMTKLQEWLQTKDIETTGIW